MTPLGSIRAFTPPDIKSTSSLGASATGTIPAAEMAKLGGLGGPQGVSGTKSGGDSFDGMLSKMVREVGAKQSAASDATQGLLAGDNVSIHQAVIAMEEASVSFQLMVEVRNKLLESYQEMMRMQV